MKIPTSCEVVRNDLKAYLDGELPTARRLMARAHLLRCADCRAEVEIMKIIGQNLREDETAPSAAFGDALRQRILDKLPINPPPLDREALRSLPRPAWGQYALLGSLAVLMFVATTTVMGRRISNTFNGAAAQLNVDGGDSSYMIAQTEDRAIANRMAVAPPPVDAPNTGETGSANSFSAQPDRSPSAGAAVPQGGRSATPLQQAQRRIAGLPPGMPPISGAGVESEPSILRRVHREARMTVAVDDIEKQSDTVEQLVRSAGGYVVSNTLSTGSDNRKTATLDLRVPVGKFETIVGDFSHLGDVRAKNVTGQDITEQHSDAQQAKNVLSNDLSIREAQLKAALDKAEKEAKRRKQAVEDPWQLRAEVRRLRIEAAQVRARVEILRKLSDLSQITIELQAKKPAGDKGVFGKEMNETSQAATETFMAAVRIPLKLLLWAFAYSPLWLPILLFYRWLFPRRDIANASAKMSPGAAAGGPVAPAE